ncbi:MAG: hypothetical protein ACRC1R_00495 [Cetobacterium sp.]|uniref:hypothetical protein n=1 Tax=Cetobacterium sp. TaxID=2071632 RepID=UPI003F3A1F13
MQVTTVAPTSQLSSWNLGIVMDDPVIIVQGVNKALQNFKVVGVQSYSNQVHLECVGAQVNGTSYAKIVASSRYY